VPGCLKKGCTNSGWPAPRVPEAPFKSAPRSINGTIQSEDYDVGGQGVAYNAANGGSIDGAAYCTDYINTYNTNDTGVVVKIDFHPTGEVLRYTVNVVYGMIKQPQDEGSEYQNVCQLPCQLSTGIPL
jgi:hypothetical protein